MNHNNYRFPEITNYIRFYWLEGQTGGQMLVHNAFGHLTTSFFESNRNLAIAIMSANAYIDFDINLS